MPIKQTLNAYMLCMSTDYSIAKEQAQIVSSYRPEKVNVFPYDWVSR